MRKLAGTSWKIRGAHRGAGALDIGTQMSIAQRSGGDFELIDGCGLDESQRAEVMALTDHGTRVAAVVNVQPFHTLYWVSTHPLFPDSTLPARNGKSPHACSVATVEPRAGGRL